MEVISDGKVLKQKQLNKSVQKAVQIVYLNLTILTTKTYLN